MAASYRPRRPRMEREQRNTNIDLGGREGAEEVAYLDLGGTELEAEEPRR